MTTTLDTLRQMVGRRHAITRREMADILAALHAAGLDLRNGYMTDTLDLTTPYDPETGHAQSPTAHEAWANACHGITVISVDGRGTLRDGNVRYDSPGAMNPSQHAEVIFVPAELAAHDNDPVTYLRRHADRVLIVDGPGIESPASAPRIPSWAARAL